MFRRQKLIVLNGLTDVCVFHVQNVIHVIFLYFNFNQRPTSRDQFYLSIREIISLNDKDAKDDK